MRKILSTIVLMLAVSMARASLNTFTVTVTNVPLPGLGTNLTVLGVTRNWTNVASAFGIQTNSAGVNESATNLFRSWSSFPQLGVTVYMTGTNAVNFRGLDLTLSQGGTWASVVSNSVASSNLYGLMLPFANLPATVRTNQANEIANAIRNYSTNATFQVSTNFNLLDSATFIWGQSAVTNISGYPTNLTDAQIASGAAIDRTKLAAGTENHVLINDGSGVPSSESRLSMSRGGTGVNLSDPGADAFVFWDDSAGSNRFATIGSGLGYSGGVVSVGSLPASSITSGTLALSVGGTAASLSDPGAHAFLVWDNSVNSNRFATLGTALSYSAGVVDAWPGSIENAVFVSKNGNDGTGARGKLSTPFLTISAAKTAASSGDTVFVFPGTYTDTRILKDGIRLHFFSGAKITTLSTNTYSILDDNAGAMTCSVTGEGEFYNESLVGGAIYTLHVGNASTISVQAKVLSSSHSFSEPGGSAIYLDSAASVVNVTGAEIIGVGVAPVTVLGNASTLTLNNCKISAQSTNSNGAALFFDGFAGSTNANTVLRDCILIGVPSAPSPVSISGGTTGNQIRIYGTLTSNLTNDATNVSILVGATRFEVDTDVQ